MKTPKLSLNSVIRRVTLRELRLLLAVARSGSILQAALEVGLTQPAVSKAIKDLEALLGVRLFDRGNRGVEPTPQGRIVLARAAAMFEELRQAVDELALLSGAAAGEILIGGTPAMCGGLLQHAIRTFPPTDGASASGAGPHYHVVEMEAEGLATEVRNRNVDFAIGRNPAPDGSSDLSFELLFSDRLQVVVGNNHPLAKRRSLSAEEAAAQRWVLPPAKSAVSRQVYAAFAHLGASLKPPVVTTMSMLLRCDLLASGAYLTVLHGSLLHFGRIAEGLRILPIALPAELPIGVMRLKGRTLTPAGERFIAHLRDRSARLQTSKGGPLRKTATAAKLY